MNRCCIGAVLVFVTLAFMVQQLATVITLSGYNEVVEVRKPFNQLTMSPSQIDDTDNEEIASVMNKDHGTEATSETHDGISNASTTIVGGWVRQKLDNSTHFSILSARIGNSNPLSKDGRSGWDFISLLVGIGSQGQTGDGCLEWDFESLVGVTFTLGERFIQLEGKWSRIKRLKMWPDKKMQLCFGFVEVSLPRGDDKLRRALYERRVQAQLFHYLPGKPDKAQERREVLRASQNDNNNKNGDGVGWGRNVSSIDLLKTSPTRSTLTFMLEARRFLPRPRISLCLDTLFGVGVERAALEFLSFYKVLGVDRVFVFDGTNRSLGVGKSILLLNEVNKTELDEGMFPRLKGGLDSRPTAPFIQFSSSAIGQYAFGSPAENVRIGYGARELTMTYCATEAAADPQPFPASPSEARDTAKFEDDSWLFVDIGLDEFLDCPSMAPRESKSKMVRIDSVINRFVRTARCGKHCLELCLMRYKFGSILLPGTKNLHGKPIEANAAASPSLEYSSSVAAKEPLLLMERSSRSQLGHNQGKCFIQPGPLLDMNLSIEVHGSLRQHRSISCKSLPTNKKSRNVQKESLHCFYGQQFDVKGGDTRNDKDKVVCRLNHYRPEFYTKCPGGAAVCNTFNQQRSVFVAPDMIEASIGWTAPIVRASISAAVADASEGNLPDAHVATYHKFT
mmetsp:Transcript_15835/g.31623  ORF Transcript_15835/g.31623 Transcript_15835/m.31623 type:complete len:678 (+) Transcript_15835:34-2067(+)